MSRGEAALGSDRFELTRAVVSEFEMVGVEGRFADVFPIVPDRSGSSPT
jgi:hypothetical protein